MIFCPIRDRSIGGDWCVWSGAELFYLAGRFTRPLQPEVCDHRMNAWKLVIFVDCLFVLIELCPSGHRRFCSPHLEVWYIYVSMCWLCVIGLKNLYFRQIFRRIWIFQGRLVMLFIKGESEINPVVVKHGEAYTEKKIFLVCEKLFWDLI